MDRSVARPDIDLKESGPGEDDFHFYTEETFPIPKSLKKPWVKLGEIRFEITAHALGESGKDISAEVDLCRRCLLHAIAELSKSADAVADASSEN